MSKVRSMTGFARARREWKGVELTLTLKSVNHRSLDLHFHLGPELDEFEHELRARLKRGLSRGHVDVRVTAGSGASSDELGVDEARLAAYIRTFRRIAEREGCSPEIDLNAALRAPGMLSDSAAVPLPDGAGPVLFEALEEAIRELNAFRQREGGEIAVLLRERAAAIRANAHKIAEIRTRALPAFHGRLKERLGELLETVQIEPQRLAQEAAILADRSDVAEETARLEIHARQLEELLEGEGEMGKKLDFLLQEMNREANTILSKTTGLGESGLGITELALAAKSDIEKIREQALNLE